MAMTKEKMAKLGADLIDEKVGADDSTLAEIEALIPLSESYRDALESIGGAVFFNNGAAFAPDGKIPFAGPDGRISTSLLFGLGHGRYSVLHQFDTFKNQLPEGCCPVAKCSGGNLVCADENGQVFFWDHETDGIYAVAPSFDDFFSRLEPTEPS